MTLPKTNLRMADLDAENAIAFGDLSAEGGKAYKIFPKKLLFLPPGDERVDLNDQFFADMAEVFTKRGLKLQVDFNHASAGAISAADGAAAGWVTALIPQEDGLYGTIEWTDSGRAALEQKTYAYLSPEWSPVTFDQNTGATYAKPRLLAVALTNRPYLEQQTALAASDSGITKEDQVDPRDKELEELRAAKAASDAALLMAQNQLAVAAQAQRDLALSSAVAEGRVAPAMVGAMKTFSESCGNDVKKFSDFLATLPAQAPAAPVGVVQAPASQSAGPQISSADRNAARFFDLQDSDLQKFSDYAAIDFDRKGRKILIMADGRRVAV